MNKLPIAIISCLFMILMGCRFTTLQYRQGPIICITFDDNEASVYTDAFPIMAQYGFRGTIFTNSGTVNQPGRLSWEQLTDLHTNKGWEIGGHTRNHEHLAEIDYIAAETAISTDFDTLSARGLHPVSFALPIGICPAEYYPLILKYYKNIRCSADLSLFSPIDRHRLGYFAFKDIYTAQDMFYRIDAGIATGEDIIVLGFHQLLIEDAKLTNNCPPEVFARIMLYLHNKGFSVLPLDEAVEALIIK
jgi:peptidoglycan/xylan/chitin deacetylase (PgdA/CDA1 family)